MQNSINLSLLTNRKEGTKVQDHTEKRVKGHIEMKEKVQGHLETRVKGHTEMMVRVQGHT